MKRSTALFAVLLFLSPLPSAADGGGEKTCEPGDTLLAFADGGSECVGAPRAFPGVYDGPGAPPAAGGSDEGSGGDSGHGDGGHDED